MEPLGLRPSISLRSFSSAASPGEKPAALLPPLARKCVLGASAAGRLGVLDGFPNAALEALARCLSVDVPAEPPNSHPLMGWSFFALDLPRSER